MSQRALFWIVPALLVSYTGVSPARADTLQAVAKHLSKGFKPKAPKRVAVLSFPYHNGDVSSGSSIVAERLTTLMVERGDAEVVERTLLDKAMSEIRLGMSGALDPATAQKLGKVLGVGTIVSGTLIDLEDGVTEVNARLIETESGAILAAATARIPRTWDDLPHRAVPEVRAPESTEGKVMMSEAIPSPGPRHRMMPPPLMMPMGMQGGSVSASAENVLTLTNDDLIPVKHRGQTDPERILADFQAEREAPAPTDLRIARRIYHRNPEPKVRARALLVMGHLLERSGQPSQAAQAYSQVLREFPEAPALRDEARHRLDQVASR